jgi:hypothetical protein
VAIFVDDDLAVLSGLRCPCREVAVVVILLDPGVKSVRGELSGNGLESGFGLPDALAQGERCGLFAGPRCAGAGVLVHGVGQSMRAQTVRPR